LEKKRNKQPQIEKPFRLEGSFMLGKSQQPRKSDQEEILQIKQPQGMEGAIAPPCPSPTLPLPKSNRIWGGYFS
jgi:hypothetical protein